MTLEDQIIKEFREKYTYEVSAKGEPKRRSMRSFIDFNDIESFLSSALERVRKDTIEEIDKHTSFHEFRGYGENDRCSLCGIKKGEEKYVMCILDSLSESEGNL